MKLEKTSNQENMISVTQGKKDHDQISLMEHGSILETRLVTGTDGWQTAIGDAVNTGISYAKTNNAGVDHGKSLHVTDGEENSLPHARNQCFGVLNNNISPDSRVISFPTSSVPCQLSDPTHYARITPSTSPPGPSPENANLNPSPEFPSHSINSSVSPQNPEKSTHPEPIASPLHTLILSEDHTTSADVFTFTSC